MEVLNKYVYKNLKLNKTRTIVTIIGITLSCALITALAGLITSFHQSMINMAIEDYGNRHVTFENVPKDELSNIVYNKNIKSYYTNENIGYSVLENSNNQYKPYLNILAYDDISLEALDSDLISGRLPQNENELAISNHISYDGLVGYKIGDKITLDIGKRMSGGYELNQNNPYNEEIKEQLIINQTKEYTIVGIVERQNTEVYSAPGYTVITKISEISNSLNVSVLYKNVKEYQEITENILNIKSKDNQYGVTYNTDLIRAQGAGFSESTMNAIYSIGAILASIIVIVSTFCIRNSFAISVAEKTKTYGMLASIGATPKQIKKSVLFEGKILGLIGITLGIIFGIIACYILIIIANTLLKDNVTGLMTFNVSIYGILISIALSCITIYLSSIGSARKASKITEIEAIKLTNNVKYKKVRESKIITKLFGVTGNISYKNMKRNKSKFRVTIISITVCVCTFITMSTFIDLGFKSLNDTYKNLEFNIIVNTFDLSANKKIENEEIVDNILKMDNIDKYAYHRSMNLQEESLENNSVFIVSVGKEEYLRFIEKLGFDYDKIKDKGLVYNQYIRDFDTGNYTDEKYLKDDTNKLNLVKIVENDIIHSNEIEIEMIDTLTMGFELTIIDSPIVIISDEKFDEIYNNLNPTNYDMSLFIKSNDASKLNKELNEYKKGNTSQFYVINIEENAKQMQNIVILVSIFLYGFIGVITLIGVTNIFNTITTSMNLRKNEFAILQSVGMSKKELSNMVLFESILYGIKSLVFGIPLGIGGSYLMYKATMISSGASNIVGRYYLPWESIAISIIFTFIIILLIMKLSLSKINKQNIIETIRNENI